MVDRQLRLGQGRFETRFPGTALKRAVFSNQITMKLYVGNLAFETTENDLQDLFEQHGPVTEVNLINDRVTGRSRGFGFVGMQDTAAGQAAIAALGGKEFNGRALLVNEARPRQFAGSSR